MPRPVTKTLGLGVLVAQDPSVATSLSSLYAAAIRNLGGPIAGVVAELCRPGALPALVHCAAGKDRTGIIIGLVRSAIGVADADVADDYSLSAQNLTHEFFRELNRDHEDGRVDLTSLLGADGEEMLRALAIVRECAGDAHTYLLMHGLSASDFDRLRATSWPEPVEMPPVWEGRARSRPLSGSPSSDRAVSNPS